VLVAGAAAPLEALEAAREVLRQPGAHLLAEGLLLGRELEVHGAALAQHGRHALAVVLRAAQQRAAALRALEVEVRGVLPGEADAAVDLDALARAVEERVRAVGLGAAGRLAQLARLLVRDLARAQELRRHGARIERHAARALHLQQHVRAHVLDALERANRPPELLAHLRVLDRHVQARLGPAHLLGAQAHGGQVQDHRERARAVHRGEASVLRQHHAI
jgi:hypothetical protein